MIFQSYYSAEPELSSSIAARSDIAERYRWNLEDLYPTLDAWKQHKNDIAKRIDHLAAYQGKLTKSAAILLAAMQSYFGVTKDFYQLHSYAHQLSDENLRESQPQELLQEVQYLGTVFGEKTAFLIPELTYADPDTLASFFKDTPKLEEFRMFLENIQRKRDYTLSEPEEKLLASASDVAQAPHTVFSIFSNAEFPYPDVTLSTGESVTLTAANYTKHRTSAVREDRQMVMQRFFESQGAFKNTFGANLVANLKKDHFYAKSRNYTSCLEASLNNDNIPVSVYENLITQIHKNLPTLHRALALKQRMLGLDALHYYDMYASIVKDIDLMYTIEEGQTCILESLQPLGQAYLDRLRYGFDNRWIDYMPTAGKRSGAYSNGAAYDIHPYILMNWNGDYNSLSTLTHELGHTMHSDLANRTQPFATSDYSIFVAEIASTFNENLLNDYLISHTENEDNKLFLLGHYLESLRGTIFRQVQFAEFEWEIHKKIEAGEPLTGESFSTMYADLTKMYYGHDQDVCIIDDYVQYEWAFVPHFYYNFYVFQYATSLIYSTAFSEKVLQNEEGAVEKYLQLLKNGASNYPIDLIRQAGIDPLSSEAFELTMQRMNSTIDQIEEILVKR
ncbi:oligoendopeptidase F [candidate division KSB3 bacterium]|uniref:Oligopeptidase F n=1 Tax=candidate division KSB3 bacterium TaxID=2044937 RepID=A0A2G6KJL4_9BACT|nr:MAG: oligoendopeptidase F [candidate division KSB3 bacterium]